MSNIALAKQSGSNNVYVYDERGSLKFGKSGVLVGYTGTSVSVRLSNGSVMVYNQDGHLMFGK